VLVRGWGRGRAKQSARTGFVGGEVTGFTKKGQNGNNEKTGVEKAQAPGMAGRTKGEEKTNNAFLVSSKEGGW